MKYELASHLDEVEFVVWDDKNEDAITDPAKIEEYLATLTPKQAAKKLADSMGLLVSDLKEALNKDLADCYKAAEREEAPAC